ncbi:MAG: hypothetical protein H5U17_15600 [Defluviimonas sp.]|nr:hypothetical protein [Defluviimonas sp.]
MLRMILAAAAGGLFGAGLLVSGMTDTARVQGWLDIAGDWDPTLAFVLGGAVLTMAVAWRIAARQHRALLGGPLPGPPPQQIDRDLIGGSLMFGAGWGLAGLCPGPATAALGFGGAASAVFMLAMLAGMAATPALRRWLDRTLPARG